MTTQDLIFFLLLGVANSFLIIGINKAAHYDTLPSEMDHNKDEIVEDSKMILWKVRYWSLKLFGKFYSKPICTCPTCMASLHSTYIFWAVMPFTIHSLIIYLFYIPMLAGTVTLINNHS